MYMCVGCGATIPWDSVSLFSITCSCGATIFWDEDTGALVLPASVMRGIAKGYSLPHLDDLVGNSDFTSPEKAVVIGELRTKDFIWMRECEQCRQDGTLERHEARLRRDQLHKEVEEKALAEGWSVEETVRELVRIDKEN